MAQHYDYGIESSGDKASGVSCRDHRSTPFRFDVHAPEFVPMWSPFATPVVSPLEAAGYYSPFLQPPIDDGGGGIALGAADWSFFADPAIFLPTDFGQNSVDGGAAGCSRHPKGASAADIAHKIIRQVEYQFSDTNLVANGFLMKIMNKAPEGYVPLSVISSWKKVKAMAVTNQLLVNALRTSEKLVVSEDGKKVRRAEPFTDRHKEELQSRMVVAENLPDDSTRNSLEKIFGIIGTVKNIRICHPQEPSSSARSSKSDTNALVSNKLHAIIEYETTQQADRAVDRLNDERNWRKGLRVRAALRRSTAGHNQQHVGGNKKPWGRGRGRPPHAAAPQSKLLHCLNAGGAPSRHLESLVPSPAQHEPRMPDGTRGFTMGRGKPAPAMPALLRSTAVRAAVVI